MSTDAEIQANIETGIAQAVDGPAEYQVGNRRVRRDQQAVKGMVEAALLLRGLQSPKRGMSVGKVDRAG